MVTFPAAMFRWILAGLLLLSVITTRAGSLEFRSDGFFASPDTDVKFFREPWRTDFHLDVDGKLTVNFAGPILPPGYNILSAAGIKTEIDPARRQITDSGVIGKMAASCRRTYRDYEGGILVRLDLDPPHPDIGSATYRVLLPVELFANRRARWTGADLVFPAAKPEAGHFVFANDSGGGANCFRFDLGNGMELGVKYLSPIANVVLSDCRQWDETNYHLQATFAGHSMLVYLCLLKPGDPFPEVKAPVESADPEAQVAGAGASFTAMDGTYGIEIAKSGQIQISKKGVPLFNFEPPSVQEKGTWLPFTEPVSFEAKGNRVEVVSRVKDKPYRAHQAISMDGQGWLTNAVTFEGLGGDVTSSQVEVSLPETIFAGKTLRAGELFVDLPKEQSTKQLLVNDWDGRIAEYDLPLEGADFAALVCDRMKKSSVADNRPFNQPGFRMALTARDSVLKYRLHFGQDSAARASVVKGNLLREGASFETGFDGVQAVSSHSWNEKMIGPSIAPELDVTTAVHGTTSLHLTADDGVKAGAPRGFSFEGAIFNREELKRDCTYTVSAWMKADRPGLKATLYCGENTWSGENWDAIPVTTEWKRYHVTFRTPDFKKSGFYLTWVGLASAVKEGSLWIDAVQLEEGSLSDFQPASEIEYGVESTSPEKLFTTDEACGVVLHVRNNGKQPLTEKVGYVIKDYWDVAVRSGEVMVNVPAESGGSFPVDLEKLPVGYYRSYFTAPGDITKELIFGTYEPRLLAPVPDDWPLACHNDPSPLVRKLGFGAVRAFEIFEMSDIAPEKGKFDFSRSDRMVDAAEKSGLTILPIFGEFRWPSYRPDPPIPPYAQQAVVDNKVGGDTVHLIWPTLEAWKDYVHALTAHYKGRITCWEVLNEPNLEMTAAQYLPYLQATYAAAKEGNPDCQLVGVCATSDATGKPDDFTQGVLDLGGAKFFDILSVHLYHTTAPEETLGIGSDKLIAKWRQTLQEKYGKATSVWNTEKSYSSRELGYSRAKNNVPVECCEEPQFLIDTFRHKAEYLIRETLLDSVAGGNGRFFWFGLFDDGAGFITIRSFQPYGLDHTEYDRAPRPELLAANGLARALEGNSHPFRQLALSDAADACIFTGDKGAMAALWNWKGKSRLVLPVGKTPFVLRNFFGEPMAALPDAKGGIVIELEGAPKYFSLPGCDGETCAKLLTSAHPKR